MNVPELNKKFKAVKKMGEEMQAIIGDLSKVFEQEPREEEKRKRKSSRSEESSDSDSSSDSSGATSPTGTCDEDERPRQKRQKNGDGSSDKENKSAGSSAELSKEMQAVLVDDPGKSSAIKVDIHEKLLNNLKYYYRLVLEEKEKLVGKYEVPEEFKAPELNRQLISQLKEKTLKKDEYKYDTQKLLASALTALGAGLAIINAGLSEGVDANTFVELISDVAKLLTEALYSQTQSRRACIIPLIDSKKTRDFLKQTKPDSSSFGSNLESEMKKFKEAESIFESKKQSASTYTKPQGNGKRPFDRRPLSNYQGNSNTPTTGQARQKLYFKRYNQGFNQRFNNKMKPYQRSIKDDSTRKIVKKAVLDLVKKQAVVQCKSEKGQFLSTFFTVEKPDGSQRFILNLKKSNKFVQIEHFKIEDLKLATKLIAPGDLILSIDLKDAYLTVPVHEKYQKYLMFKFEGNYYKFVCLPFGLSTSPYVFTKILKPIVISLRSSGLLSVIYLDDYLCIGNSEQACAAHAEKAIKLFQSLGFLVNFEKLCKVPSNKVKFLGGQTPPESPRPTFDSSDCIRIAL
ncbi:uncharacterized protein LOC106658489 [Trichogramma pretiosum]|uniref:uncharacterized protein LOC106658489 n=1 Tax=Trichogramma pretiosum TaxID=7493 RepID=UPI0006C9660C|nr:uncharacterized protein LOC106658489 [Trichogramma pretiosum]